MYSHSKNWIADRAVILSGLAVTSMIAAILFFLASESRYAFDRKFVLGYRIALQDATQSPTDEVSMDPNASLIALHAEGQDALDEKEELFAMPRLADLAGIVTAATGTALGGEMTLVDPNKLYRDDLRAPKWANVTTKFLLFGYATPEVKDQVLRLRWEPDASCDPKLSAFTAKLRLVKGPMGFRLPDQDLVANPAGSLELPPMIARTDSERTNCYVFEVEFAPRFSNNATATLWSFGQTQWAPTGQYPLFGVLPLLLSSLITTFLALLIAVPIAMPVAVYMSEYAPNRVREVLKVVIEMLSSVPTVVLGFFGLMVVAPGVMSTFGQALGLQSGRCLLTAAIMLGVLIVPILVSFFDDNLKALPHTLRDGGLAMGFTQGEVCTKLLIPAARSGFIASTLMGAARAIGETMILWILAGGTPGMPTNLGAIFQSTRGIADTIGTEMANVEFEQTHYGYLFLIGLTLFSFTILLNLTGNALARRTKWRA